MAYYTIHLERIEVVRQPELVRFIIGSAFEPLVRAAGYDLNLVSVPITRPSSVTPDVSLDFRLNTDVLNPHSRILAEQSGTVLVGSILNMRVERRSPRVCTTQIDPGDPLRGPRRECHVPYGSGTRPLFTSGDPAFARTVGNIAVHELGHTIGGLRHFSDPINYMFTGAAIDRVLGPGARTYANLRRHWSRIHRFDDRQVNILTGAIRTRNLLGVQLTTLRGGTAP